MSLRIGFSQFCKLALFLDKRMCELCEVGDGIYNRRVAERYDGNI